MKTEDLGNSKILDLFFKPAGVMMGSKLRQSLADLKNVHLLKRDALNTGLDTASIDKVLLFGVIPFPLLPLNRLLPEMYRLLKPEGTMGVWLFPPVVHFWVPKSIPRFGLFTYMNKRNGVYNYKRC